MSACSPGRNTVIEETENDEVLRTINITDILDNGDDFDESSEIKLPKHQRYAAHTLNLIASVDIQEAEKDGTYKVDVHLVNVKQFSINKISPHSALIKSKKFLDDIS